jgi:hypothetical protein
MMFDQIDNLAKSLSWTYAQRTGIEYEELYAEAALSFLSAQGRYDPERSALTTFAYVAISNHLKGFRPSRWVSLEPEEMEQLPDTHVQIGQRAEFLSALADLSKEAQHVCLLALSIPSEVWELVPKSSQAQGLLITLLREQGWRHRKIKKSFGEIRTVLKETR